MYSVGPADFGFMEKNSEVTAKYTLNGNDSIHNTYTIYNKYCNLSSILKSFAY